MGQLDKIEKSPSIVSIQLNIWVIIACVAYVPNNVSKLFWSNKSWISIKLTWETRQQDAQVFVCSLVLVHTSLFSFPVICSKSCSLMRPGWYADMSQHFIENNNFMTNTGNN